MARWRRSRPGRARRSFAAAPRAHTGLDSGLDFGLDPARAPSRSSMALLAGPAGAFAPPPTPVHDTAADPEADAPQLIDENEGASARKEQLRHQADLRKAARARQKETNPEHVKKQVNKHMRKYRHKKAHKKVLQTGGDPNIDALLHAAIVSVATSLRSARFTATL